LLFSPNDLLPLDEVVFNTEAHPLPRFQIGKVLSTGWKRGGRKPDAKPHTDSKPASGDAKPASGLKVKEVESHDEHSERERQKVMNGNPTIKTKPDHA
jgi:hypothetical protein